MWNNTNYKFTLFYSKAIFSFNFNHILIQQKREKLKLVNINKQNKLNKNFCLVDKNLK